MEDEESGSDSDFDSAPTHLSQDENPTASKLTIDDKVDSLIGRMDKFLNCFVSMQNSSKKQQKSNDRKFKHLQTAHNELSVKTSDKTNLAMSKISTLEERLERSEASNKKLMEKFTRFESIYERTTLAQMSVNNAVGKQINTLEINQGFTDKSFIELGSEVKERKIIIAGVYEESNECVSTTALTCLNKLIDEAMVTDSPGGNSGGFKRLVPSDIDKVYRIGKPGLNNRRGIAVSFIHHDNKDMVYRAKAAVKDTSSIRFYINDDLTTECRAHKTRLKQIATAAKSSGLDSKLSGNKISVGDEIYNANELSLIPNEVTKKMKQEKEIDGGIVFKGDNSILSNFFPAPFLLKGQDFEHNEQYFQYMKLCHHGKTKQADRVLRMSYPWRIKVIGDRVALKASWNAKRMKVMYNGMMAKFRQNWPLQEELLKTAGKRLYEATTDLYFICGIGFDSSKWETKDWPGENATGLVLEKVRDDLQKEISGENPQNFTLTESEPERLDMDTHQVVIPENMDIGAQVEDEPSQEEENQLSSHLEHSLSYTDVLKSTPKKNNSDANRGKTQTSTIKGNQRQHHDRSYYAPHRGKTYSQRMKRPQDRLSKDDRKFLHGQLNKGNSQLGLPTRTL